jgi:hypothetical protein
VRPGTIGPEAQDLVHGGGEEGGVGGQALPVVRVLGQHLHGGRELAAGGLRAGEHEAGDHGDDVVVGEPVPVDLGLQQAGDEVVAGLGPAGRDALVAVGPHLGRGPSTTPTSSGVHRRC